LKHTTNAQKQTRSLLNSLDITQFIDTTQLSGANDSLVHIFTSPKNIKPTKHNSSGLLYHTQYNNKKLSYKSVSNPFIELTYKKLYRGNQQIACGFISKSDKIGIWKYLSHTNKLDSLVNHDKEIAGTFCEVFHLGRLLGLVGKNNLLSSKNRLNKLAQRKGFKIVAPKQLSFLDRGWLSLGYYDFKSPQLKNNYTSSIYKLNGAWLISKNIKKLEGNFEFFLLINFENRTIEQHSRTRKKSKHWDNSYNRR
jgi:hypothetical protein